MDPLRTLTPDAAGLAAPALSIGGFNPIKHIKRVGLAVGTGGLSELGGVRTAADIGQAHLETQQHKAEDAANAEAARLQAQEQARRREEQIAMTRARRRARGRQSTLLTSPLGLVSGAGTSLGA